MVDTLFSSIENRIINEVMLARQSIKIAVAWFNQRSILNILTMKTKGGVSVELILNYDDVNTNSQNSLDFTDFKESGGVLIWAHCKSSTMHEKFCIIDDETVLHGTYNWTNRAEKRNDEHLCVCKGEPNMAAKFVSRFYELKDKYSQETNYSSQIKKQEKIKKKYLPKVTRLRAFMEEMARCDLQKYSPEYLKSFRDYWTEETSSTRMRFETKAVFLMIIELDNWSEKQQQLKEQEEYDVFYRGLSERAQLAYDNYVEQINSEISSLPDYRERLRQMNQAIEADANLLKQIYIKDIVENSKNSKSTVYQYIKRVHVPVFIFQSKVKKLIDDSYGRTYTFDNKRFDYRFLQTIMKLQQSLGTSFCEVLEIPYINKIVPKESYVTRYIESCIFHSKFKEKIRLKTFKQGFLTKERLLIVIEAFYALKEYRKLIKEQLVCYKGMTVKELYIKKKKKLPERNQDVLVNNVLENSDVGFDIEVSPSPLPYVCIRIHDYSVRRLVGWEQINYDLNLGLQKPVSHGCSQFYSYHIPPDIYYARVGFTFLSIEEACGFKIENVRFKPLNYYYDEMAKWPFHG